MIGIWRHLLNNGLAVFKVLNQNIDFARELGLGIFSCLQLLFKLVDHIIEAIDFNCELLLKSINIFNTKTGLIFVFLLPVSIFLLPLLNGSLKIDLDLTELLNLDCKGLDVAFQRCNFGFSSITVSSFIVSSTAEFIKLGSKLVLVHSSMFNSKLHLIQFLV